MSYKCLNKERKTYFKKEAAKNLSTITKLIFDFDGVLVDTSQSYGQTIIKVVDYYFLEILGLEGEKGKLATLRDIQKFKDTGLYNNDWNLSYAIITYYLAILMRKLKRKDLLQDFAKKHNNIQFTELRIFLQTLGEAGDFLRRHGLNAIDLVNVKNDSTLGLESFLTQTNMKNLYPLKTTLKPFSLTDDSEQITLIQRLVPYDLEKADLLKRLFEELYLGKVLFNKFYGISPIFKFNESFLEKEFFIATKKTLDSLLLRFGKFFIYSEKSGVQGIYLLRKNKFEHYFDRKRSIFLEDLVGSEVAGGVNLGKPNPTLFIEMIKKLVKRDNGVAYVGDGVADALLVENARLKGLSNLLFLGVLCSSQYPNNLLSLYVKHGADAIMTDMNDIPNLLTSLGGKI